MDGCEVCLSCSWGNVKWNGCKNDRGLFQFDWFQRLPKTSTLENSFWWDRAEQKRHIKCLLKVSELLKVCALCKTTPADWLVQESRNLNYQYALRYEVIADIVRSLRPTSFSMEISSECCRQLDGNAKLELL